MTDMRREWRAVIRLRMILPTMARWLLFGTSGFLYVPVNAHDELQGEEAIIIALNRDGFS